MAFMVLATGLYINACAKGEECIPVSIDMIYEKDGFMLTFWCAAASLASSSNRERRLTTLALQELCRRPLHLRLLNHLPSPDQPGRLRLFVAGYGWPLLAPAHVLLDL